MPNGAVKDLFSSVYLAAKVLSALLNAASVVLFVRIAGDAAYGEYLIGFAFAFIAFSFATQWLLSAHFGRQSPSRAHHVATAAVLMILATLPVGLLIVALCAMLGFIGPALAWPACALVVGLAVYYTANELGRAQLAVGAVALGAFLRSFGTLVLGSLALWRLGSPAALLLAVAVAHVIAAAPIAYRLRRSLWAAGFAWPDRAEYRALWRFGAPLIIAGGASALALSIDRIILDRVLGAAAVGPYGAVLDFTKQSFIIVGESVTVSYVSYAKALHGDERMEASRDVLRQASATIAFLAAFGLVFFALFGTPLFATLFGLAADALDGVLVWLALGNAFLLMRAYYFGQVIYFTGSVRLELRATLVALLLGVGLGLWLIPAYGTMGAAVCFALVQAAALGVFVAGLDTRRVMPIAVRRVVLVFLSALAMLTAGIGLQRLLGDGLALPVNLALMTGLCAMIVVRWNLFDAGTIWMKSLAKLRGVHRPA